MQFDDVTLKPNGDFVINVHDRKTSTYSSTSTWTVSGSLPRNHWSNPTPHYLAMRSLREAFEKKGGIIKDKRLLMQIRDGKFHNQAIGSHQLGRISKKVAEFNNVDPKSVKGYTMRRTSATVLAAAPGSNTHIVRKHLGHKSYGASTEYIDSSVSVQRANSERLAGVTNSTSSTTTPHSTTSTTSTSSFMYSSSSTASTSLLQQPQTAFYAGQGAFANCNVVINIVKEPKRCSSDSDSGSERPVSKKPRT